jgi:undecaprenyl-diphosphatase
VRKFLFFLALPIAALAQPAQPPVKSDAPAPVAELSLRDAVILGLVEGVTEFLPISSTGHLIVATHGLGLVSEQPLLGADGRPLWYKPPSAKIPAGIPMTQKLAADTYTVVIQFGAIAAVGLLYWRQFVAMALGLMGRDPAGLRLLINIIVAFIPAAVIGLLVHDWVEDHLFSMAAVIFAQCAGAGLMFYAEAWRRKHSKYASSSREPSDIPMSSAAGIGLLQCMALWPGTSRSMMTIVGGYFSDLDPRRSAEFSFLLGFVTLSAATLLKSYQGGAAMIAVFGWSHVLLGCLVAAIAAAIAVRSFVSWLSNHGLVPFAIYRLATAALLGWLVYRGFFN